MGCFDHQSYCRAVSSEKFQSGPPTWLPRSQKQLWEETPGRCCEKKPKRFVRSGAVSMDRREGHPNVRYKYTPNARYKYTIHVSYGIYTPYTPQNTCSGGVWIFRVMKFRCRCIWQLPHWPRGTQGRLQVLWLHHQTGQHWQHHFMPQFWCWSTFLGIYLEDHP